MNRFKGIINIFSLCVLFFILLSTGCGQSGGNSETDATSANSDSASKVGELSLSLTDATTDAFKAVYVTIHEIHVASVESDQAAWLTVSSPNKTYNLLELVNGELAQLGVTELEVGQYSQLRLVLGEAPDNGTNILGENHPYGNYIVDKNDDSHALSTTSGEARGIKLAHDFSVEQGQTTKLILDFDALKSVVIAGKSGNWILRPNIKVLDPPTLSTINGTVTHSGNASPLEGVLVSVHDTSTLDHSRVKASTITNASGDYTILVSPGTYTVSASLHGYQVGHTEVTIESDENPSHDFSLNPVLTGTLEGVVVVINGEDEQIIDIRVIQILQSDQGESKIEIASINIANGGTYSVQLPVGEFWISANAYGANDSEFNVMTTIMEGSATLLDIELEVQGDNDQAQNDRQEAICHKGDDISVSTSSVSAHLFHGDSLGRCNDEEGSGEDDNNEDGDDVEDQNNTKKETICHKGKTISISKSAVSAHIGHGDVVGSCESHTDSDGDGLADDVDNCPNDSNEQQSDIDGDGIGDQCDTPDYDIRPLVHYRFDHIDTDSIIDHGSTMANANWNAENILTYDEQGRDNEAYALKTNNDFIFVNTPELSAISAGLNNEITIAMDVWSHNAVSLLDISGAGGEFIKINFIAGTVHLEMDLDGDGKRTVISHPVSMGQWYNIALTYSKHTSKLYINGVAVGLDYMESATLFNFLSMQLLREKTSMANISDFRIYNRSLKHHEVKALHQNLVASFTMDRAPGNTAVILSDPDYLQLMSQSEGEVSNSVSIENSRFNIDQFKESEGAAGFDGQSTFIELEQAVTEQLGMDAFSFAAWIKPPYSGGNWVEQAAYIVGNSDTVNGDTQKKRGWSLSEGLNYLRFEIFSEETSHPMAGTCFNMHAPSNWSTRYDGWMHVAGTWNQKDRSISLYINGDLYGLGAVSDECHLMVDPEDTSYQPGISTSPIQIGKRNPSAGAASHWKGTVDHLQLFGSTLQQVEVRRLFEDGYLARAFTDCAYPYQECNPAVYDVPTAFKNMAKTSTAKSIMATDTSEYNYGFGTGWYSHVQGLQRFLPGNNAAEGDDWFVYSRSHSKGHHDVAGNNPYRVLGIVDMSELQPDIQHKEMRFKYEQFNPGYDPETLGYYDHGGGIQIIGQYLFIPLETAPVPPLASTVAVNTFVTAIYRFTDLISDTVEFNKVPSVHLIADPGGIEKGGSLGDYQADVFASVARLESGQYLWIDAFYEAKDAQTQTDLFRFNISNNTTLNTDPGFALVQPKSGMDHIDIDGLGIKDLNPFCFKKDTRQQDLFGKVCTNGNWNTGTLVSDTRGGLYLIMTDAGNDAVLLEVQIDKMAPSLYPRVTMIQEFDSTNKYTMDGTTFKAGGGGHVTENGILSLFATELSNSDGNDIRYVWFNGNP